MRSEAQKPLGAGIPGPEPIFKNSIFALRLFAYTWRCQLPDVNASM